MENTPLGNLPSRSASRSPSWIAERDVIRLFGDRKTRAILAIYHARRSAKKPEFFVHPDIAECWGLNPQDLNWALSKLDGSLIETVKSKSGRYRTIRLLPQFEDASQKSEAYLTAKKQSSNPASPGEERVHIDTADVIAGLAKERM